MRSIGERISWRGVNRTESGMIEEVVDMLPGGSQKGGPAYVVRLGNGRLVIVNEKSILE